jgi:hypothetical protein
MEPEVTWEIYVAQAEVDPHDLNALVATVHSNSAEEGSRARPIASFCSYLRYAMSSISSPDTLDVLDYIL